MLGKLGPKPGCPAHSTKRRRWLNHNSCGAVLDEDDPVYYFQFTDDYNDKYESESLMADYNTAAVAPRPEVLGIPLGFLPPGLLPSGTLDYYDDAPSPTDDPDFSEWDPILESYCLYLGAGPEPYYEGVLIRSPSCC